MSGAARANAARAEAGSRARQRRMPARPWRRRAAGRARPLADQPAAHPRPRRRSIAGRRDRGHGPAGPAARLGRSADADGLSVAGHVENCCCRCCASIGEPVGAGRLLPWRNDGDRGGQSRRLRARRRRSPRPGISRIIRKLAARAAGHVAPLARPPPQRSARCRWKCCRPPSGRSTPSARCANSPSSAALDPDSAEARRFIALEDWANEGEPLPYPGGARTDRGSVRPRLARDAAPGRSAAGAITDRLAVPTAAPDRRPTTGSRPPQTAPRATSSASARAMSG